MPTSYAARRLAAISNHLPSSALVVVVLPNGTKVSSVTTSQAVLLLLDGSPLAEYFVSSDKKFGFDISSIGTSFEGVTKHIPRYELITMQPPSDSHTPTCISIENLWAIIYALFTVYHQNEYIPLSFSAFPNAQEVTNYLTASGLGRTSPSSPNGQDTTNLYFLSHEAFWQGAGTTGYHSIHWLPSLRPPFPTLLSFSRKANVVAKHPLRPTKPQPGEVLYKRWCSAVNQMLEITYFDLDGTAVGTQVSAGGAITSRHLAAFHKWHNDPRVSSAWQEQGSLEDHRRYIETAQADPHMLPCLLSWDGELSGYIEVNYTKEDHVAPYFPVDQVAGEWERNIHVLTGETKFLGNGRAEIWLRSILHYIFLADLRTKRVAAEPDHGNPGILRAAAAAQFHQALTFDFPYKRSVLVLHTREKFFRLCRLH